MITKEQVQAQRYSNSDKVPAVGDVVTSGQKEHTVGKLGGIAPMFQNCTFDDVFVLTHPAELKFVR